MDSFEKFSKEKLTDKNEFYSYLKDTDISKKSYLYDINVWSVFKMNKMGHYHDLYLQTDVLLSSDVFKKFIRIIWIRSLWLF